MINHPFRLTHNIIINLTGQAIVLVAALLIVPLLIQEMGVSRFGIFALMTALLGYFNFFDFGIGTALIHKLSQNKGELNVSENDSATLIQTSMFVLGVLGLLCFAASWIVMGVLIERNVLNVPPELGTESLNAFRILSLSIPVIALTSGIKSILHAEQRFDLVNFVQIPAGILNFVLPLAAITYFQTLTSVAFVLCFIQIMAFCSYRYFAIKTLQGLNQKWAIDLSKMKKIAGFGGWMSLSYLVAPIMIYGDRFFIGGLMAISAVTFYTIPFDLITKLSIITAAFAITLFPNFSNAYKTDLEKAKELYLKGLKYSFIILFPIILIVLVFAKEGFTLWLGGEFAKRSTRVMQWLAVGVFINSLAQVGINLIIGMGRPDLSAKAHLCETPIYIALLWFFIRDKGIEGAAMAWFLRVAIDAIIIFIMADTLIKVNVRSIQKYVLVLFSALIVMIISVVLVEAKGKIIFLIISLSAFSYVAIKAFLNKEEHLWLKQILFIRTNKII